MYKNTKWLDEIVDADTGETLQTGTNQDAANFNNAEGGISDVSAAVQIMLAMANVKDLISKPWQWEVGKEYSFGDGVFGRRFVGTAIGNNGTNITTTLLDLPVSQLLATGGYMTLPTGVIVAPGNDGFHLLAVGYDPTNKLYVIVRSGTGSGSPQCNYNVWATYKKGASNG